MEVPDPTETVVTPWDPAFLLVAPSAALLDAIGRAVDAAPGGRTSDLVAGGGVRRRGRDALGHPFESVEYDDGSRVVLGVDDVGRTFIEARWGDGRSRRALGEVIA